MQKLWLRALGEWLSTCDRPTCHSRAVVSNLTKTLEKDKVSNRKDLMIYLLTELSKKEKPVRMDEFFFETGYANGLDSFREVLDEMSRLEWINIIDARGTPAFGVLPTRDIKYTISIKGVAFPKNRTV